MRVRPIRTGQGTMDKSAAGLSRALKAGIAMAALVTTAGTAMAGGFAVREQSTVFQGTGFAGAAAGGALSSMYWNPAATASLPGLNTESSYTLILPKSDVTVTTLNGGSTSPSLNPNAHSGNIGIDAAVSSSYGSYQVTPDLWLGMAINSPFGLATKPENPTYYGNAIGSTTKLLTINANPTLAYRIAPGITVGAGFQIEWARGKLMFANYPNASINTPGNVSRFKGDDWAFGATAGIMLEPAAGTNIGLGWRSQMTHDLDGALVSPLSRGVAAAKGEVKLPDIVTLSFRQALAPDMRLLGTVEWTNWSRFDALTLTVPGGTLLGTTVPVDANWSDSWFFSLGGEYDYSPTLTLRGGVAYEISPVDDPTKRLTSIPDADRVWLNIGASYRFSEATTLDFAYSHIFVEDARFDRLNLTGAVHETGTVDSSVDLISVGLRTRW